MGMYKLKPFVVEARLYGSEKNKDSLVAWCGGNGTYTERIHITTPDGRTLIASVGDWIIRGVDGEFHRCKASIFDATYEEVKEGE